MDRPDETTANAVNSLPHAIDHRRSFLRSHVADTLTLAGHGTPGQQGSRGLDPVKDLLAIQSLRSSIRAAWDAVAAERGPCDIGNTVPDNLQLRLQSLTTPQHFFGFEPTVTDGPGVGHAPVGHNGDSSQTIVARASEESEFRLYWPVPVRLFEPPRGMSAEFHDLSHLLAELTRHWTRKSNRRGYGVLLRSRSGAGKTVACWKAWFDCLDVDQDRPVSAAPRLAGCVPCWIGQVSAPEFEQLRTNSRSPMDLVLYLLGRAAGLFTDQQPLASRISGESLLQTLRRLGAYCAYGPRLLIFVDLNHFEPRVRHELALGLKEFQEQFADQHSCVVTYRSAIRDDVTSGVFNGSEQFLETDLLPLRAQFASSYLRSYRTYEDLVFRQFPDLVAPERNVEEECRQLEGLIERTQSRGEPLISTPLLMHWAAELSTDQLRRTHNITHLYRHVVDKHVDRERKTLSCVVARREDHLTAMTRIALLIQSQGNHNRVRYVLAKGALQNPHGDRKSDSTWWPTDEFWWKCENAPDDGHDGLFPYYHKEFRSSADPRVDVLERLLESGLFRRDGELLGFVHDSLIPYFAGSVALREYLGPDNPAWHQSVDPDWKHNWIGHTYARIMESPEQWVQAAEFMAGALEPLPSPDQPVERIWFDDHRRMNHEAVMLVQALTLSPPSEAILKLTYHIARGASRIVVLDLLAKAIEERRGELNRKPRLLPQVIQHFFKHISQQAPGATEVHDNLLSHARTIAAARVFEDHLVTRQDQLRLSTAPWFQLVTGSRSDVVMQHHDFESHVSAVRVVSLPSGTDGSTEWVLVGLDNGELHLWEPRTGMVRHIGTHAPAVAGETCAIIALHQQPEKTIYTADDCGGLRIWSPLDGDEDTHFRMRTIAETGAEQTSFDCDSFQARQIAVTPAGDIAILDDSGRLHLWCGDDFSCVYLGDDLTSLNTRHIALVPLPSGQFVTARNGCLYRWDRDCGRVEQLFGVNSSIEGISAAQGSVVVWNCDPHSNIAVWDRDNPKQLQGCDVDGFVLAAKPIHEGSVIVVTNNRVERIAADMGRTTLYPPEVDGPSDEWWTNIETCWFSEDMLLFGDFHKLLALPLTRQAED